MNLGDVKTLLASTAHTTDHGSHREPSIADSLDHISPENRYQSVTLSYSAYHPRLLRNICAHSRWRTGVRAAVAKRGYCKTQYYTYTSHVMTRPVFVICEQQKRRSVCASAQSDQRLRFRCLDSIISLLSKSKISGS